MTHPVEDRIAAAAQRAGRDPASVRLVAVTKTHTPSEIRGLLASGVHVDAFGENRVQEALPKIEAMGDAGIPWHFIGRLQTNKVRLLKRRFALVHSIDRIELVDAMADRDAAPAVLIEVGLAGEPAKGGCRPEDAVALLRRSLDRRLPVEGLMTIPPQGDLGAARQVFRSLAQLRDELRSVTGLPLPELSMGMTDDFEVAIAEGATIVRIGRALFGPRRQP